MSELHKSILKAKLPPRVPKSSSSKKLAPFGAARRKDYTPVAWNQYFEKHLDVKTDSGTFRVYMSPEPDQADRPRIVTLHGGGYSGLSWALFTKDVTSMIHCQVLSLDIRGHGDSQTDNPDDLSGDTLAKDVSDILHSMYPEGIPPVILIGHSMGGAVAVRAAHLLEEYVEALVVIDVVEGTAMESLASMQSFLRCRPTHFRSIEHAIEWCVRSGQVRNLESAKVSMPGQIVNCETKQLAANEVDGYIPQAACEQPISTTLERADVIAEEEESQDKLTDLQDKLTDSQDKLTDTQPEKLTDTQFKVPDILTGNNMKYKWRIDLSKTEQHWSGWFRGLSALFLSVRAPALLLLASIDGLDTHLTLGQMQGKFQMQVLPRCGHAVHEDSPAEVARVVAAHALRHRLSAPTPLGELMHLVSQPGC